MPKSTKKKFACAGAEVEIWGKNRENHKTKEPNNRKIPSEKEKITVEKTYFRQKKSSDIQKLEANQGKRIM